MKENFVLSDKIQNSIIIHIPHSGLKIPKNNFTNEVLLQEDVFESTDWYTDEIFNTDLTTVKTNLSRIYVDFERLEEDDMDKFGRGFYYTNNVDGILFRDNSEKENVLKLFKKYHNDFDVLVDEKLKENGFCTIIDCHSFNEEKLSFESDLQRPEICIGTNEFHTPKWLIEKTINFFKNEEFEVLENSPYSGTFVSQKHYGKDKRVFSIMIEINKKLYLNNKENIPILNRVFKRYIENLY